MSVAIYFLRVYVELYEFSGRVPFPLATAEQPVESRPHKNHDIGLLHYLGAACERAQLMVVGQNPLGHRHRVIWYAGGLHQLLQQILDTGIRGSLAEEKCGLLGGSEQRYCALH